MKRPSASKRYGWETVLYVNGGEVTANQGALEALWPSLGRMK